MDQVPPQATALAERVMELSGEITSASLLVYRANSDDEIAQAGATVGRLAKRLNDINSDIERLSWNISHDAKAAKQKLTQATQALGRGLCSQTRVLAAKDYGAQNVRKLRTMLSCES